MIFSLVQYVDDTLLVLPSRRLQLTILKSILLTLYASTAGLKVKFHKSFLGDFTYLGLSEMLNVDDAQMYELAECSSLII